VTALRTAIRVVTTDSGTQLSSSTASWITEPRTFPVPIASGPQCKHLPRMIPGFGAGLVIETRSLPALARCYPCSFTFYVADPSAPFPIAVPGFLGTLAALGTSRRKVDSHQRLATLP
jgi:hypothetical protein